jgi:hypothetical protein
MKEIDLLQAKKHSSNNKQTLSIEQICGCFYCLRIFDSKEIDWQDDAGETAMCPYCGIDAVIGESSGMPVTKAFLKEMRRYWFTESE